MFDSSRVNMALRKMGQTHTNRPTSATLVSLIFRYTKYALVEAI